jgi:pyruvate-formate lyase-activating enzyme
MSAPNDKTTLANMPLPPGVTELEWADAILEFARLYLEQEPVEIHRAAAMIKAARERMTAAGKAAP